MSSRFFAILSIFLFVIILVLVWLLFTVPSQAPAQLPLATTTPAATANTPTSTQPLSASVTVSSPASGATVGQTFSVSGVAPNAWYFEAVFPIQVRDGSGNLLGHAQGKAQSDWTKPGPVAFSASVTLDAPYHGPATLILLKDNESGLPQNDDSVSIPIVIQ